MIRPLRVLGVSAAASFVLLPWVAILTAVTG